MLIIAFSFLIAGGWAKTSSKKTSAQKITTSRKAPVKKTSSTSKTKKAVPASKKTVSVESLRNRRNALQKEISRKEGQLAATSRTVRKQLNDLALLNGKIDVQKKTITRIQSQLDSLTRDIDGLNRQYRQLSSQLADRKKKYRQSIIYLYKNKDADSQLLFILSADNFTQMLRRYRYVNEYGKYQRKQGELIKRKQEQVNAVKKQLETSRANKNVALDAQKRESEILSRQQDERQRSVNTLKKKQREIQSVIASSKKQMAALDAKIDYYVKLAIEQERKRREAEEKARREAQRKAERSDARKEGKSLKPVAEPMQQWKSNTKEYALTQNFTANKGRLPIPITGSYIISARYGNYSMDGFRNVQLSNKGINITGQPGACARCIFPGEVSAVFSLGGQVNVIVRHGNYISVYCNLSSASVRKGQKVDARAIIGKIAKDVSGRCTLHFQLRKETATLNPESWLAR